MARLYRRSTARTQGVAERSDTPHVDRLWKIWLGVALTLTVIYFVAPHSSESKLVLYNGTGLLSIIALAYGATARKAMPRAPWVWFAAGLTSFLTADVIYYLLEISSSSERPPFPNVADFFYLMMYPLMIVGLTKMVRTVAPGRHGASMIDAAVVGIAMFGALWVLFVDVIWVTDAVLGLRAWPMLEPESSRN